MYKALLSYIWQDRTAALRPLWVVRCNDIINLVTPVVTNWYYPMDQWYGSLPNVTFKFKLLNKHDGELSLRQTLTGICITPSVSITYGYPSTHTSMPPLRSRSCPGTPCLTTQTTEDGAYVARMRARAAVQSRTVNTVSRTVILSSPLPMIHRSFRRDVVKFKTIWEQFPTPRTSSDVTSSARSSLPRTREGRKCA